MMSLKCQSWLAEGSTQCFAHIHVFFLCLSSIIHKCWLKKKIQKCFDLWSCLDQRPQLLHLLSLLQRFGPLCTVGWEAKDRSLFVAVRPGGPRRQAPAGRNTPHPALRTSPPWWSIAARRSSRGDDAALIDNNGKWQDRWETREGSQSPLQQQDQTVTAGASWRGGRVFVIVSSDSRGTRSHCWEWTLSAETTWNYNEKNFSLWSSVGIVPSLHVSGFLAST